MICGMLTQTAEDRLPALLQLLLLLSRDVQAKLLASPTAHVLPDIKEERIGRLLNFLNDHYREEHTVDQLATIAALSRSSLHRLFKHQTGLTLTEYITQLRIGNACALLINTGHPIALISDQVGYRNLANFNRQFKVLKGETPRQFRSAFGTPGRRKRANGVD
jgi:AraC-like DNA-binding protein